MILKPSSYDFDCQRRNYSYIITMKTKCTINYACTTCHSCCHNTYRMERGINYKTISMKREERFPSQYHIAGRKSLFVHKNTHTTTVFIPF